ncbi:endonuclease/exonuclease/phosphatase family protein [Amycolatopsis sp. BJA-103]|uniref:endonuclease/exonuclease/phosphatase family protein n=1 Tax=unclassified Amycolatopsis TaxID=2618356 RepID=UPI000C780F57|nr:endonuclease/exonuclease/phosphatase family protein [Amycolatopsis sp. BJA-103]AUI59488.1 endonuclease/exonuclease/phosphatase [Amycolatopsis sp. BJA-103]PNE17070.1 endonuclease/exonuclease/phosphatase [Amycolatopsis sp. BJA-103]
MTSAKRRLAGVLAVLLLTMAGTAAPASAATNLTVLSFNIWLQGSHGGIGSVVNQIRASGANVVALSETGGGATEAIADALGWQHTEPGWDIDVISALPIQDTDWKSWNDTGARAITAKIAGVWVYSIHLDYTKYGPYNACFDKDGVSTILADETNRRRQAEQIAEWTGSSPGIVAGDLNSPSHQDWTAAAKSRHCGYEVAWPTTKAFTARGFTDSYRKLRPDPVADPGDTWSPVVKDNQGRPEPQDRIDFVFYRGGSITPKSTRTFGGGSGWPSDHLAVLSAFTVS